MCAESNSHSVMLPIVTREHTHTAPKYTHWLRPILCCGCWSVCRHYHRLPAYPHTTHEYIDYELFTQSFNLGYTGASESAGA
jgi:hypothetical protein